MWLLSLANSDVELLGKRIASSRLLWTPNRGEAFVVSLVVDILAANFINDIHAASFVVDILAANSINILALGQNSKAFIRAAAAANIFLITTLSKYFSG